MAALGLTPSLPGVGRAFAITVAYTVLIYGVDKLLGANYAYIVAKPPQASLLDLFGPWPWYIVVALGVGLILFLLFWLAATGLAG